MLDKKRRASFERDPTCGALCETPLRPLEVLFPVFSEAALLDSQKKTACMLLIAVHGRRRNDRTISVSAKMQAVWSLERAETQHALWHTPF